MNAHKDVIGSVEEMGAQLSRRVEDHNEREHLKERLNHIDIRWRHLVGLADTIRWFFCNFLKYIILKEFIKASLKLHHYLFFLITSLLMNRLLIFYC